jgi:SAM-dependent methyltransferase
MMSEVPPYDPREYDDRYRSVYEAGADSWEENHPTEALEQYANNIKHEGLLVLDLGCGEGRDSRFLSKKHQVTAVDISPNAIRKAHQLSRRLGVELDFIVADVSILPLRASMFELIINIACLHMMTDQNVRDKHLSEVQRVLGSDGIFFSCNLGGQQSYSVQEMYEESEISPGEVTKRKIIVGDEEREIDLPIIAAWPKSETQYVEEFTRANLIITDITHQPSKPIGHCWVIVAGTSRR